MENPNLLCSVVCLLNSELITGLSLRFQVARYLLLVAGEVPSSHGAPPPHPPRSFWSETYTIFQKALPPKNAIFIKSTAIISGFMMITSLLKKTTTFWDTKIIVKLLYVKARWRVFLVAAKWEYTCKHQVWKEWQVGTGHVIRAVLSSCRQGVCWPVKC